MNDFEFRVYTCTARDFGDDVALCCALEKETSDGWELVAILPEDESRAARIITKRRKDWTVERYEG